MRIVAGAIAGLLTALAVVFAIAFYERYWLWRDCFNDLGRCWDPVGQQVYVEQAGIIWGGGFVITVSLAALCAALALRGRRRL